MTTLVNSTKMQNNNLRIVFFPSIEEVHKVIEIKEVGIGIVYYGGPGVIVPARVVPLIRKKALISYVLKPSDSKNPTPEQAKAKRERRGIWKGNFFITRELLEEISHAKTKET